MDLELESGRIIQEVSEQDILSRIDGEELSFPLIPIPTFSARNKTNHPTSTSLNIKMAQSANITKQSTSQLPSTGLCRRSSNISGAIRPGGRISSGKR